MIRGSWRFCFSIRGKYAKILETGMEIDNSSTYGERVSGWLEEVNSDLKL